MKLQKPKFWDLKKPNLISYIFLPFTIPIRINNLLVNLRTPKKNNKIKSICVGNIYLGGTGKTPTTIKLYNICKDIFENVCTGKKYYSSQNDEQILLKKKTNLICEENREKIIEKAINLKNKIIIFDDGLQDKKIHFDTRIVCFDIQNWIGNGYLLPSGPLREKLNSLKKYDIVFLKGNSENSDINEIIRSIKNQNSKIEIFQTYYQPVNLEKFDKKSNYLIFSGIGNPNSFKETLSLNNINIIEEMIFPDHNIYTDEDINIIKSKAKNLNAKIITTEKDYVKLSEKNRDGIDFLEIDLIIKNEKRLIDLIKLTVNEKS